MACSATRPQGGEQAGVGDGDAVGQRVGQVAPGARVEQHRRHLPRMLTAKPPCSVTRSCVLVPRARQMSTMGGSRLTLEKELAVMPCQCPAAPVVTITTPLGHCVWWFITVRASRPRANAHTRSTDRRGNSATPKSSAPWGSSAISVIPLARKSTRQIFGPRSRPLMIFNAVVRASGPVWV